MFQKDVPSAVDVSVCHVPACGTFVHLRPPDVVENAATSTGFGRVVFLDDEEGHLALVAFETQALEKHPVTLSIHVSVGLGSQLRRHALRTEFSGHD